MLAQGCHAHYGRMASNQVARLHSLGAAYGKVEPCSEDVVVDIDVWKVRFFLKRDSRAVPEERARPLGSKRRMVDSGYSDAPATLAPAHQDHPSNGGRNNASQDPNEGRVWATKERQTRAHGW